MDVKQLEAFVCVVQNRSFSKAGQQLNLTQPTISAHVLGLEQELGVKLILRDRQGVRPTEAGQLLLPYAERILAQRDEALQVVGALAQETRGSVCLAASTIPGQYYLPQLLQSFRSQHPDVSFELQIMDSDEVANKVLSGGAEVGFTGTRVESGRCVCHAFAQDQLVLITPNAPPYRACLDRGFPLARLAKETFIRREAGSGTRRETERFLQQAGIDPDQLKVALEARSTESIKKMVAQGLGVAIISQRASEDYCEFGKLLAFPLDDAGLRRQLYLIRRRREVLSAAAQSFYHFARDYYGRGLGA